MVLNIAGLYSYMAGPPGPHNAWVNLNQSLHAQAVAGSMISTGGQTRGVAPGATLRAGDLFFNGSSMPLYIDGILTTQRVAQQPLVRSVNLSFGDRLPNLLLYGQPGFALDGNSMYSLFLDWSSRRHGVLYTISGNEIGPSFGFCVPTDTFNGLVVGATTTHDGTSTGIFDRIASFNVVHHLPNGGGQFGRRTIDIVAPGDKLVGAGYGNFGVQPGNRSGTSYAAPHVAGAVAILNERMVNNPNIGANAFRPEVTKAILMNSADKVQGILDMDKTILRGPISLNSTGTILTTDLPLDWVQARNDDDFNNPVPIGQPRFRERVPLDSQLGVGQLNVRRAVKQLDGLEQKPGFVSAIGWDSNTVGPLSSPTQFRIYHLPTIPTTDYVSATLVWQRRVDLVESLTTDGPNPVPVGVDGEFSAEAYLKMGPTVPAAAGPFAAGDPLIDLNGNGVYDSRMTESFSTIHGAEHAVPGLSNLDLYLLPRGWNNLGQAIARSVSTIYSVEHIFEMVPGGDYDLVVAGIATVGSVPQDYGLA